MKTNPIQRILVPTDLSEFGDLALQYALLFQKKFGSEITLLYAEEFSFLFAGEFTIGYYLQDQPEVKRLTAERLREYAKKRVPEPDRIKTLVVDDTPAHAIVATAANIDADLIIMGTHGRFGFRRALLGSVTERVLRETDRPVMTVTPELFSSKTDINIRTILCPVNFTAVARQALEQACMLATALDAELIVVHVSENEPLHRESVHLYFSDWVDPLIRWSTKYSELVVSGNPAEEVLQVASGIGADLIVLGAQHERFSDATVIGTTTERVTRFANRPVLTVTRKAAAKSDAQVLHTATEGTRS